LTTMRLMKRIRISRSRTLPNRTSVILLTAAISFLGFALVVPRFASGENLLNMLRETAVLGILATGMTLIFVVGEIDISVGSLYGLLNVVMGVFVVRLGWNPWFAAVCVVLLGALKGIGSGAIVTQVGIPSFVVTLAELVAYRSAALLVSGEQPSVTDQAGSFYSASGGYLGGSFPCLAIWMLGIAVAGGVALPKTKFGAHVYATGGDRQASASWGIPINRITILCFTLMGALCGLSGALLFGWLRVAAPITGTGLEFSVIAAVILGGTSLRGGRGSVLGSMLGACIIEMLSSALILLGLSQPWKEFATGSLILVVSVLDWAGKGWIAYAGADVVERSEDARSGLLPDAPCDV
jgi:ribose transport system permease protein